MEKTEGVMSDLKSIEYRLATLEDIDQLVKLRCEMQSEVNKFSDEKISAQYIESVKLFFQSALVDKTYFCSVAVVNNQIVGTAGVCFYLKPPSILGGTGLVGYVTNVYTAKLFRRKGISRQLMKELNTVAKHLRADRLHLGATAEGLNVYRAVGYLDPKYVNLEIKYPFGINE